MNLLHLCVLALLCVVVAGIEVKNNATAIEGKPTILDVNPVKIADTTTNSTVKSNKVETKNRGVTSTDIKSVPPQIEDKPEIKNVTVADGVTIDEKISVAKSVTNATNANSNATSITTVKPTNVTKTNNTVVTDKPITVKTTPTNTTTKTTSTITTKNPIPKKPLITHSVDEYPEIVATLHKKNNNKLNDEPPSPPETEPVRDASAQMHTDMFVPLITIMFTMPLAAGVLITTYRRFRDCWSTRHYRRMDFLVDGMYND